MRLHTKIRIIFFIVVLLLSAFFASYVYIQKTKQFQKTQTRYMQTSRFSLAYFRNSRKDGIKINMQDDNFHLFLKDNHFELVPKEESLNIIKHAIVLKTHTLKRVQMKMLKDRKSFYLYLKHPKLNILLKDKKKVVFAKQALIFYLLSLLFLIGLYFWIVKSLKPLKELQKQIQKVSEGDLSVCVKNQRTDEIGEVSNAFDDALRKLESLINSRQLFLRSIMHELNTPIAKGKILNTFTQDEKLKSGYETIFERLELIVKEFSKIEQMLSANYELKIANFQARDLVEQALELMIMDEENLEKSVVIYKESHLMVKTDFSLFPLAIKNLIDNAIKYSTDKKVEITISQKGIYIASKGEQFTDDVERYFKPFHSDGKGLGLGLYIVHTVTDMLEIDFKYQYRKGENIFIFSF